MFELHDARFESVVDIVGLIGEVVGDIGNLGFEGLVGADGVSVELGIGFVGFVLEQSGPYFPTEVESGEGGIGGFELFDTAEALEVVIETAVVFHELIEDTLAFVAEGAVTKVVGEADAFGQIFVGAEGAGEGSTDGGHFHGVGEAGAEVVGDAVDKDLGFVFETAEAAAVKDAVAVAGETGAGGMGCFGVMAAECVGAVGSIGAEVLLFGIFPIFSREFHRSGTINEAA